MPTPRCPWLTILCAALPLAAQDPAPRLLTYKAVDGAELKAHVFEPKPSSLPRPAILLFHGGGWDGGDGTWVYPSARRFAALGLVAVAIDYRLSDGKQVTPLEAMEDARDAFRWIRRQAPTLNVDPRKVAAYGLSAGGHLAAATALVVRKGERPDPEATPNAVLLYSPAVAISHSGWARKLLLDRVSPQEISPDQYVRPGLPPMLINQGQEDSVTSFEGAVLFSRAMKAAGNQCELRRYSGLGHLLTRNLDEQEWNFDPDPVARADAWRAEEAFLARLGFLAPQPQSPESPEAVVRAYAEALTKGEMALALARLSDQAVGFRVEGDHSQVEVRGLRQWRAHLEAAWAARPGARVDLHMLSTNGVFVSVRERAVWKGAGDREEHQNAFVVFEVAGGRIRRIWRYPAQP